MHPASAISAGARWQLFAFGLALIGVNLLGALAFGFGLLFTMPVSALATTYVYRRLQQRATEGPPAAAQVQTHAT